MVSVRLAPLPLGVKNYGLALCEVDAAPYMLAGLLVNAPFSVLWALTGSSCHSIGEALELARGGGYCRLSLLAKAAVIFAVLALASTALRRLRSRLQSHAPEDVISASDAAGVPDK
eukprot:UN4431